MTEYSTLIAELDKTLSIVREMWMEASPESPEKRKAMLRLDQLLDERLRLMKLRDGQPGAAAAPVVTAPVKKGRKPRGPVNPPVPPVQPPTA